MFSDTVHSVKLITCFRDGNCMGGIRTPRENKVYIIVYTVIYISFINMDYDYDILQSYRWYHHVSIFLRCNPNLVDVKATSLATRTRRRWSGIRRTTCGEKHPFLVLWTQRILMELKDDFNGYLYGDFNGIELWLHGDFMPFDGDLMDSNADLMVTESCSQTLLENPPMLWLFDWRVHTVYSHFRDVVTPQWILEASQLGHASSLGIPSAPGSIKIDEIHRFFLPLGDHIRL